MVAVVVLVLVLLRQGASNACLLIHFCVCGQFFGPERLRQRQSARAATVEIEVEVEVKVAVEVT